MILYVQNWISSDIKITECDSKGCLELKYQLYLISAQYRYTILFLSHKGPTYLTTFLNFDLNRLSTWFEANRLSLT